MSSHSDENELIKKFISALTIFNERSAALENKVLGELNNMRNDIQQLKQTISAEHTTVSLPHVMEQQRLTMIELLRQLQPQAAFIPQQFIPSPQQAPKPFVPIQQQIPKTVVSTQPPATSGFGETFKLKEGEWYCNTCYVKNPITANVCACCTTPKTGETPQEQKPAVAAFKPQAFAAPNSSSVSFFNPPPVTNSAPKLTPQPVTAKSEDSNGKVNFSFAPKTATPVVAAPQQKPSGLFGTATQDQSKQTPIKFSFKPAQPNVSDSKTSSTTTVTPQKAENKSLFGSAASPASEGQTKPLFGGNNQGSFASLANNASGTPSFLNKSGSNAGIFSGNPKEFPFLSGGATKQASVVKKQTPDEDDGADKDDTVPEEFTPDDSQFKRPDIALPDLVDVKTGEENEEVVFSARCRLYRFVPGSEAKERGTGDMKLLKHKETGKIRCVMRREQVLKVCANFAIPDGFEVHNTKRGENVLTWVCKDFSDPEQPDGEVMTLICRFKDIETAKKFKEITAKA